MSRETDEQASETSPKTKASAKRKFDMRELFTTLRFAQLRHRDRESQSLFGVYEGVAVGLGALLLLAALSYYFFSLAPARTSLEGLQRERTKLQDELRKATAQGANQNQPASIPEVLESVKRFEADYLTRSSAGRTAVIEEVNRLVRSNNARITSAVSYASLAPVGTTTTGGDRVAARPTNAKNLSHFPGIGIQLTVEGGYANLRRLVRDLEAARGNFIVINGVELEGVTETNSRSSSSSVGVTPGGAAPTTAAASITNVSLRLDLAAYFQRDAFQPSAATTTNQPVTNQTAP